MSSVVGVLFRAVRTLSPFCHPLVFGGGRSVGVVPGARLHRWRHIDKGQEQQWLWLGLPEFREL